MADHLAHFDAQSQQLICEGAWDIEQLSALEALLRRITWPDEGNVTVDGAAISKMDGAGAWLLAKLVKQLEEQGLTLQISNFSDAHSTLLQLISKVMSSEKPIPATATMNRFARFGKAFYAQWQRFQDYLAFVGYLAYEQCRMLPKPAHWRIGSLFGVIYRSGYQALIIIALLSFMVGVVITYQMGLQLKNYGANIYIVDLLGISILREFGPLLTSIMVAGRTGSAFTAELGMMKLNQEIDALNTMGVTPAELLLLPRIIGLVIVLPLLTIWSDIFGVIGGMIMSNNMLDITWYDFLFRFPNVVPLKTLIIGLGKTPVFALIIASVSCFQGMRVSSSAASLGANTTRSVVLSIFFILVADAGFSIIFSELKL